MMLRDQRSDDEKYRLSPAEIDAVIRELAYAKNRELDPRSAEIYLPVTHGPSKRKFYICPMSRDSVSNPSHDMMPHFWKNISRFLKTNHDRHCTLLMPVRLCRFFFKAPALAMFKSVQRQHAVLFEINLSTEEINVHDAQGNVAWACYPDKIMETIDQANAKLGTKFKYSAGKNYHAYGTQATSFDCGYFTYFYVAHFLEHGAAKDLNDLYFSIVAAGVPDKQTFLLIKLGKKGAEVFLNNTGEEGDFDLIEDEVEAAFAFKQSPIINLHEFSTSVTYHAARIGITDENEGMAKMPSPRRPGWQ